VSVPNPSNAMPESSEKSELPGVVGTLDVLDPIRSHELGNERPLYVWLPASYASESRREYPVIYMQDGQNLFTDALAFGREWQVDEHMTRLSALGLEAIVVGVPNAGAERTAEYTPFPDAQEGGGRGDAYLRFLIGDIMPLIESRYRVLASPAATGIMGSSLGALISLYAFFRAPERFGFVGAMSPSLWFAEAALLQVVEQAPFVEGRIYLDIGTEEGPQHLEHTQALHRLLLTKGYCQGTSLFYVEEDHAGHDEEAWARRLRTALYFLLPSPTQLAAHGTGD
jgi:predicted alpha/beta superfamily hydrolase